MSLTVNRKTGPVLGQLLLGAAILALHPGCGAPRPEATATDQASAGVAIDAELLSRDLLFGNPDRAAARLSPNGDYLSFLAPVDGVLNVWVTPAENLSLARPVTEDKKRGVRIYFWAYTSNHIIYLQDKGGDENWHVHVVDLEAGTTRNLTPFDGVRAEIKAVSHLHPEEILIGLNKRDPKLFDVHRLNLASGEVELVQINPGFIGFVIDDNYDIRIGQKMTPDGGMELLTPAPPKEPTKAELAAAKKAAKKKARRIKKLKKAGKLEEAKKLEEEDAEKNPGGDWDSFLTIAMEDMLTTGPIGFDKSGETLYMLDSRGRDTGAFATLNVETKAHAIVAEDPRADLQDLMIHPTEKNVEAVGFTFERKHWKILDDSIKADFEKLATIDRGDFEVISRTLDDDAWIVAYVVDNGPVRYHHYDREAKSARFLFTNRSELEGKSLVEMHPVVVESRDGKNLVSYFSLPPGTDPDGDGRPSAPLPTVLVVHGGPWARVSWGYNAHHQWFANRGYAVLNVNFRGSTGFGKGFINAANMEWAGKMHDDLLDVVGWAVEEGIAREDQVAIFGGSYGGYATLVGLTFTPEKFACGVDIVGPSNLVTLLNTIPPYWAPMIELFTKRVGDHRTPEGKKLLEERSPLNRVNRIVRPLLIAQGANDPRVKQAESDQIVEAMKAKGTPVTYVLYPDEGHGFARPSNRLSFYAVTEAFLSGCLGGRFEEIGDDFEGSSITTPHGAAHVPGLAEALPAAAD